MMVSLQPTTTILAELETVWRSGCAVNLASEARPKIEVAANLVARATADNKAVYKENQPVKVFLRADYVVGSGI